MTNHTIAISVHGLSKTFKIYTKPADRLKEILSYSRKKYYSEFQALHDINFVVPRGEFLGIIGRNGAGKSTLLKILSGEYVATSGIVKVNGSISLLQLGVGFNSELNGIENVKFAVKFLGYDNAELSDLLDNVIEFADIGEFIHYPVKTYSSGMYSRLSFAIAISIDPEILIVDEVLSVGDMRFASKCLRKMHEIKKKGTTVILVTHDVSKVAVFCNRALWLKDGKIEAIGPAKEIAGMYQDYMMLGDVPKVEKDKDISFIGRQDHKGSNLASSLNDDIKWIDLKPFPSLQREGIKITHAALYRKNNHTKASIFTRGEHILIYLKIYSASELIDILPGWNLTDKRGLVALHGSSEFSGEKIDLAHKGSTIVCCFDLKIPPLRNGDYIFSFGIRQYDRIIFKVNEALPIKISHTDSNSRQGGYVIVENAKFTIR